MLCKFHAAGYCRNGNSCPFSHVTQDVSELPLNTTSLVDIFSVLSIEAHLLIWSSFTLQNILKLRVLSTTMCIMIDTVIRSAQELNIGPSTSIGLKSVFEYLTTLESCENLLKLNFTSIIDAKHFPDQGLSFFDSSLSNLVSTKNSFLIAKWDFEFNIRYIPTIIQNTPQIISDVLIEDQEMVSWIQSFTNMTSLTIKPPRMDKIVDLINFDSYPTFDKLKTISLSHVVLPNEPSTLPFSNCSPLRELYLSDITGGSWLFDSLAQREVTRLYLNNTSITSDQLRKINASSLSYFGAGDNSNLNGNDYQFVLSQCPRLESLMLTCSVARSLVEVLLGVEAGLIYPSSQVTTLTLGSQDFETVDDEHYQYFDETNMAMFMNLFPQVQRLITATPSVPSFWQEYQYFKNLTKLEISAPPSVSNFSFDLSILFINGVNIKSMKISNIHQPVEIPLIVSHSTLSELVFGSPACFINSLTFRTIPRLNSLTMDAENINYFSMETNSCPVLLKIDIKFDGKKIINNTFVNFDTWLNHLPFISSHLEHLKISGALLSESHVQMLAYHLPKRVCWKRTERNQNFDFQLTEEDVALITAWKEFSEKVCRNVKNQNVTLWAQKIRPNTSKIRFPRLFTTHPLSKVEVFLTDIPIQENDFLNWPNELLPVLFVESDHTYSM